MLKIKLSILALISLFTFNSQAQMSLSVNYAPGFPITAYSGDMKMSVVGANIKLNKHMDDHLWFNLGAGFHLVPFKSLNVGGIQKEVSDVNLSLIPVTAGGQFFFTTDKIRPYFSLDLGYVLTMQNESEFAAAINRNNFIIAPAAGIFYNLSDALNLNLAVRNNIIIYRFRDRADYNEAFQMVGVELGVNYKF